MATRQLALTATLTVLAVACGSGPAGVAGTDPGLVHVHGLAVDPADPSALYAATHTGLFHVTDDGQASRVTEYYHDLMGFTVTDQGRFVASGHPDLTAEHLSADGQPPLLGLVESPDAGASWQPVSLLGETDFHGLDAAHGSLYGADATSGRFMVSPDGRRWDVRSTPELFDLAVSPEDPDLIMGATGEALVRSDDGGRTWQATDAPAPGWLAWGHDGLYVAEPGGTVRHSSDHGQTWIPRGMLDGTPEVLLATSDGRLFAAVSDVGIVVSVDGGETWRAVYATGDSA